MYYNDLINVGEEIYVDNYLAYTTVGMSHYLIDVKKSAQFKGAIVLSKYMSMQHINAGFQLSKCQIHLDITIPIILAEL